MGPARPFCLWSVVLVGLLMGSLAGSVSRAAAQTTLIRGGSIFTMDPNQRWAQALVIRGNRIEMVGTEVEARKVAGPGAEVIDLQGGLCLPGFIDSHNHLAMGAITKRGVSVAGLKGKAAILAKIRSWVEQQPREGLLLGYGWMPDSFESRSPRREWLDEITGDRPMLLLSADAHDMWFNTAAMRACGLTDQTPDPEPGKQYYRRDEKGWPTGHAIEGAAMPMLVRLGAVGPEAARESQQLTLARAPSQGITSYFEAGVLMGETSDSAAPVYEQLIEDDRSGKLPVRIVGTVWTRSPDDDPKKIADRLKEWNRKYKSEHLKISVCKMWSDGTLMSRGALLLDPFCDQPHARGKMTFPSERIEAVVDAVQQAGFDMHIHTDADGSVRTVLDVLERVRQRRGGGFRHTIAHNSLVHPDDVPRYAALGVVANVTPLWGTDYNGSYRTIYTKLLGSARMEQRLFPYGDLMRSGAVVTYGADIPGVDVDEIPPLLQIEAAVTRKRPGFPKDLPLVARQRVSVEDALRAYTVNGAYQLRMENEVGSLEKGKKADLVVLGRNIFEELPESIHTIPVVFTMMDGRVTHDARP
ncbi:MAG: amidohydrolase [Verrucomicrobia bacterium]|nr:amidohydrolase [Verrucomicrobiota bacterium]